MGVDTCRALASSAALSCRALSNAGTTGLAAGADGLTKRRVIDKIREGGREGLKVG